MQKSSVFIDSCVYIALFNENDSSHARAIQEFETYTHLQHFTSQAVIGEVLTVGSQRFSRQKTIEFVSEILESETIIIYESAKTVKLAWEIFYKVKSKNVSWVDCLSQAYILEYHITQLCTFDSDFKSLNKIAVRL